MNDNQEHIEAVIEQMKLHLLKGGGNHLRFQKDDYDYVITNRIEPNGTRFFLEELQGARSFEEWFSAIYQASGSKHLKPTFLINGGTKELKTEEELNSKFSNKYDFSSWIENQKFKPMPENHHSMPAAQPAPVIPQVSPAGLAAGAMHSVGQLGSAALAAGLGFRELTDLQIKANRSDEFKDELHKLKEENHRLILKNRELESEVKSAEKSKELALMTEKVNKQSFWNSESGKALLEAAPEILSGLTQKAQGLGAADISETKKRVIEFISTDNCPENHIQMVEALLVRAQNDPMVMHRIDQVLSGPQNEVEPQNQNSHVNTFGT